MEGESAFFYKTGLGRLDMSLEKKACMGRNENVMNSGYEWNVTILINGSCDFFVQ